MHERKVRIRFLIKNPMLQPSFTRLAQLEINCSIGAKIQELTEAPFTDSKKK